MAGARVALLFGGRSSEHSISCISAAAVWQALNESGYVVTPVAVTPKHGMVVFEGSIADLRRVDMPVVTEGRGPVTVPADPTHPGLDVAGSTVAIDVAFPVLHGPWGEDGTIQGLLEMAGIRYVGSGVLASALCMHKPAFKAAMRDAGITVAPWVAFDRHTWMHQSGTIRARVSELGSTLFVKPSRAGSSIGISKISMDGDEDPALAQAVKLAMEHDPRVIVEQAVTNAREIEVGVRQLNDGTIVASCCAEIAVREGFEFYDFDAKYVKDGADLRVPAPISEERAEQVKTIARQCFIEAGCEGLARVDFFVTDDEIIVNEVNTMPGFTPISMFPRVWQYEGISYPELIDSLISEALSRAPGLR